MQRWRNFWRRKAWTLPASSGEMWKEGKGAIRHSVIVQIVCCETICVPRKFSICLNNWLSNNRSFYTLYLCIGVPPCACVMQLEVLCFGNAIDFAYTFMFYICVQLTTNTQEESQTHILYSTGSRGPAETCPCMSCPFIYSIGHWLQSEYFLDVLIS